MGHACKVITALRALVNIGWILTLSHGLEVHFATIASKPSYGAGSNLEHVDAPWLEATDDHCVGLASDGGRVIFWLVLKEEKQNVKFVHTSIIIFARAVIKCHVNKLQKTLG